MKKALPKIFMLIILAALCGFVNLKSGAALAYNRQDPEKEETEMDYDFSVFINVEITGADLSSLSDEELSVLYRQAQYCQAMTDADLETMREIVSEDMIFTHMSGMQQTREQYFADIAAGRLRYFTIGIENPRISVNNDKAEITFTSVLNANAYGANGYMLMDKRPGQKEDTANA